MLSALLTIVSPAANGENSAPAERVLSVVPDLSHGSITIATTSKNPLPAPLIQYLPGPDGKTLMVADFEGVSYQLATHLLKPENSAPDAWRQSGIQEIRIGQFSSQPPTMRISIGAFNARAFRALAFHARPGALVMKWTPGYPSLPSPIPQQADRAASNLRAAPLHASPAPVEVAPLAPDYKISVQPLSGSDTAYGAKPVKNIVAAGSRKSTVAREIPLEKNPENPPDKLAEKRSSKPNSAQTDKNTWMAKSDRGASAFPKSKSDETVLYKSTNSIGAESKTNWESAKAPSLKENTGKDKVAEETQPVPGEGQVFVSVNDVSQLKEDGSANILVKTDKKLNYKVFRLHEPERYVIDFDGLPALESAQLPPLEAQPLVRGMRTGTPDDTGLTQRLVLDLKDNTVDVDDELTDSGTALSLMVRPSSSAPLPSNLQAKLVKDKLIVLDAGHGGSDPGAQRAGVSEKDLTMQITNQLKKRLTQLGARVVMTRTDDSFVSLEDRVKITNQAQPDLFVSIHINALESTSDIYGIETYYQTDQSRPLAAAIHQQLVQGLAVPDRSIRKARFYVINHTLVPAILAEVGFISNEKERDNLAASQYQVKIADSVSAGIVEYLTEKQELAGKTAKPSF